MTARYAVLAVVVVWGCSPHPAARRPPWSAHVGDGPLAVRGAAPTAPGPTIYRALAGHPDTRAVLAGAGEPDTLRIVCGRDGGTRVILSYRGPGGSREVVAEPTDAGGVCGPLRRAHVPASPRRVGNQAPDGTPRTVAADAAPTTRQRLECPIDPGRPDCRMLCAADGGLEWCE